MQNGQFVPVVHAALHVIKAHLEYICAICTVLAAGASFVAMRQFRRANQLNARLLELAEQKPQMRLSLFELHDVKNIVVAAPLKEDRHLAIPFAFTLTNEGEKTATDLQLTIRMSKFLCPLKYTTSRNSVASISRIDSENFSTLIFDFRGINPNEKAMAHIDVLMPSKNTIKVEKSDFRIEAYFSFAMSATIACRDTPTTATHFEVEFINTYDSNAATVLNNMNQCTIVRSSTPQISAFRRIFLKPTSPLTTIALVDFSENDLKQIGNAAPVDKIDRPTAHVVMGAKTNDDGSFILPAIGVLPRGFVHDTPESLVPKRAGRRAADS